MDAEDYPSVDNIDFERTHDNVCRSIIKLFDKEQGILTQQIVVANAEAALEGENFIDKKAVILAALQSLMQDKQIKKLDDGFCHAKRVPKYRCIDAPVSPYVVGEPPKLKVPPQQAILDDVIAALGLVPERFTMSILARAWSEFFCKEKSTVDFFMIMKELVKRGLIYKMEGKIYCKSVKKQERFRSLDDDWS